MHNFEGAVTPNNSLQARLPSERAITGNMSPLGALPRFRETLDQPYLLDGIKSFDTFLRDRTSRSIDYERQVIQEYLGALDSFTKHPGFPADYCSSVRSFSSNAAPMNDRCNIAVNVPVYNEERCIERFLESILNQTPLHQASFELNILINSPEGRARDNTAQILATYELKFRSAGIPLNIFDVRWPVGYGNVGLARRMLSDITLLRASNRKDQQYPLYIKHEDADTFDHSPTLLRSTAEMLNAKPWLDACVCKVRYESSVLRAHQGMFLERLFSQLSERHFVEIHRDIKQGRVSPGEAYPPSAQYFRIFSTAYLLTCSAESLALTAGGFSPIDIREDLLLGECLSVLRGTFDNNDLLLDDRSIGSLNESVTSAMRRHALAFVESTRKSHFLDNPYLQFADHEHTSTLRTLDSAALVEAERRFINLTSENVVNLAELLSQHYVRIFHLVYPERASEITAKYAEFLEQELMGGGGGVVVNDGRIYFTAPDTAE